MQDIPLPGTGADITSAWLNAALKGSDILGQRRIRTIAKQQIAEGVGFIGNLYRIQLEYDEGAGPPATLIAKLPTSEQSYRDLAMMMGLYEREHRFYREIAPRLEFNLPRIYLNEKNAASSNYVLLLEDLQPAVPGDQIASCSIADARLALSVIARLHAAYWDYPNPDDIPWIPNVTDTGYLELILSAFAAGWPALLAKQGTDLPPFHADLIRIGDALSVQLPELVRRYQKLVTITHFDYRLDNLLFEGEGDARKLYIIDWQLITWASGLSDVCYFLGGNFPVEFRREHEQALIRYYYDTLCELGVTGYSFEQCWQDYRFAALSLLIFMAVNQNEISLADLNERGQSLLTSMYERYSATILDLDVLALCD